MVSQLRRLYCGLYQAASKFSNALRARTPVIPASVLSLGDLHSNRPRGSETMFSQFTSKSGVAMLALVTLSLSACSNAPSSTLPANPSVKRQTTYPSSDFEWVKGNAAGGTAYSKAICPANFTMIGG